MWFNCQLFVEFPTSYLCLCAFQLKWTIWINMERIFELWISNFMPLFVPFFVFRCEHDKIGISTRSCAIRSNDDDLVNLYVIMTVQRKPKIVWQTSRHAWEISSNWINNVNKTRRTNLNLYIHIFLMEMEMKWKHTHSLSFSQRKRTT